MEIEPAQDTLNHQASEAEVCLVAIVRDQAGNPKFDDPHNVPEAILQALTPSDLEYLNKLRNQ